MPARWSLYARRARAWSTAGQLEAADADYRRALELTSRSVIVDWYRQRVADCERRSHWQTALWYVDRCLAAEPTDGELHAIRARVLGRLGRVEDHLAEVTKVAEHGAEGEGPDRGWRTSTQAARAYGPRPRRLYAGGEAARPARPPGLGTRARLGRAGSGRPGPAMARCAVDMLERHSDVETPEEADFIARTCALGPEATDDFKAAIDLAELAVGRCAPHDRPDFLCTLGAILSRAGRFPDLRWARARRVGRGETGPQGDPGPAVSGDGRASARPGR